MKICTICGEEKELTEFYSRYDKTHGLQGRCKKCANAATNLWARENRDIHNERSRLFREKHPEKVKGYERKKAKKKDPMKVRARSAVRRAVKIGKIRKDPCETCGTNENVQGHHEDYSKPLEVRWLCSPHHMKLHRKHA